MGLGLENPLHILILLVIVVLLFGAKRLPELGRGLGTGMREFKDSVSGRQPLGEASSDDAEKSS